MYIPPAPPHLRLIYAREALEAARERWRADHGDAEACRELSRAMDAFCLARELADPERYALDRRTLPAAQRRDPIEDQPPLGG